MGRIRQITAILGTLATDGSGGRRRLAQPSGVDELRAVVEAQATELDRLRAALAAAEETADELRRSHDGLSAAVTALTAKVEGVEPLHVAREHMTRWLEDHGRAIEDHGRALEDHVRWLENHDRWLDDHNQAVAGLDARVLAVEPRPDALSDWLSGHDVALEGLHVRTAELENAQAVSAFTQWLGQADLVAAPLISIILPTRNRATLVPRAVESVLAQSYPNWELVIVDDASSDNTAEVLASFGDPRIRAVTGPGRGVCAARNVGLAVATGEVVTYADDDNVMHPLWLKALAWAFDGHPAVEVAYGGFLIDDIDRVDRRGQGSMPRLMLRDYDRATLLRENLTDIGALAHRAGMPAARFDESLREMGDWDLLCALTTDTDPLVIPVVACYYSTSVPDRLSHGPTHDADRAAIRRKYAEGEL
ncbi:Glycosyltransferase [Alloactinosynnema sp. L-07]|uniref:glycosyltransferase n=1 Tax=Alloactinosynnema sp. L-07 TaxID=1653480 RepID=UPI00065F036A|nr:glycosyltransferase [Alloactinosynnema sp. L-07]CRK58978.1 Glycosyltransferase [Alloactinosynnema sp. L-07]